MSEVRLSAEPRTEFGKGAARRVRRAARVPAVIYGHGTDPRHVSLPGHELMLALKKGQNTLLRLELDNGSELVLPRGIVRDPIKGFLEHLDLVVVRQGERQTVDIQITLTGQANSEVIIDLQSSSLSVEAEVTHIPTGFEINIEDLRAGDKILASQVPLPEGVTLAANPDDIVVQGLAAASAAEFAADTASDSGESTATTTEPAAASDAGDAGA